MKGATAMLVLLIPLGMAFGGETEPTDARFWDKTAEAHGVLWREYIDPQTFQVYTYLDPKTRRPLLPTYDDVAANRPGAWGTAIENCALDGARFEDWKRDPFLALLMYIQLQEAFGWDAFRRVFAEYRDLPASARPKNDDEKRDQWMARFSRAAGRNLGPFFKAWGVPTSEKAGAGVAGLPGWMPKGFPPE